MMGVSGGRTKGVVVVAAVAIACCLLMINNSLPLRAVCQQVSEEAAEEFWDQFLNPSAYPGTTASLTPLEKTVLGKFAKGRRETKGLKYGGMGAVAGGGLMGLLAPMLRVKSTEEKYVKAAREQQQQQLPMVIPLGEKSSAPPPAAAPTFDEADFSTRKGKVGVGKRLKQLFTPSKDADWSKRGSNAAAVAAAALLLGGLGMLVAAHLKNRKMKKVRRKLRPFLAQERKEMGDDCESSLRPDCMTDLMQQIEAARNPTGPLNNMPPSLP